MKLKITFLIPAIFFAAAQICSAQENPKAVMFDRFGEIQLGELWARIDIFVQRLSQNTDSDGYLVIHPGKNSAKEDFKREKRLKAQIINHLYQSRRKTFYDCSRRGKGNA